MPGGFLVWLTFCDKDDLTTITDCDETTGIRVELGPLTEVDLHNPVTIDATNFRRFGEVVDLLTNGDDDVIVFQPRYKEPNGTIQGGGTAYRHESGFFF